MAGLPEYTINKNGQGDIDIRCPVKVSKSNSKERVEFREWLQKLILDVVFQIAVIPDTNSFVDQIIKNERSFDRAIMFSDVEIAIANLLGDDPKIQLSDWKTSEASEKFPLRRDAPWDLDIQRQLESAKDTSPLKLGEGEPPASLFNIDKLSHKDIKIVSLRKVPSHGTRHNGEQWGFSELRVLLQS